MESAGVTRPGSFRGGQHAERDASAALAAPVQALLSLVAVLDKTP
jgi:hypothetical protein